MQVKYVVKEIEGKGLGLVADEFIPKGTLVWSFEKAEKNIFKNKEEFENHIKNKDIDYIKHLLDHAYGYKDVLIELKDDSEFTNHSRNGNIHELNPDNHDSYASRDI